MNEDGFAPPAAGGGSMLTSWPETEGNHEPLNLVISAKSDVAVLAEPGFRAYMHSGSMASEFLGLHRGARQLADLGDGQGARPETGLLRHDYGAPGVGTALETLRGGNHVRYWVQRGSGAVFLAASAEESLWWKHRIGVDGYNRGRDLLVSRLVGRAVKGAEGTTAEGESGWGGWRFRTAVVYIAGLLTATAEGINHAASVGGGGPAIDGLIAVLTVTVLKEGS